MWPMELRQIQSCLLGERSLSRPQTDDMFRFAWRQVDDRVPGFRAVSGNS